MKTIKPNIPQVQLKEQVQIQIKKPIEIPIKYDEKCALSFAIPIGKGDTVKVENTEYGNFTILVDNIKRESENIVIDAKTIEGLNTKKPDTIEDLMTSMLPVQTEPNDKNVTFEITLTKRQKDIFDKKGGVNWLKKALVGQGQCRGKKK